MIAYIFLAPLISGEIYALPNEKIQNFINGRKKFNSQNRPKIKKSPYSHENLLNVQIECPR